ncbi:hypothetical protein SAMN05421819_1780 [Bryocella elongata]|uniref:Uncharacterized protein n=2 Tax=Bryocella elongata TaxID=863522 RepID=A0A1H5WWI2_9BACT|nr:hypothetical protein SAMN05421819_1780 [Bryocella elongata]
MRFLRGLKICVMVVAILALVSLVVEHLWNWLMPSIFHLRLITYWEAMGLLVLSKLLLGGFHKHAPGGNRWNERREWKRRMKARWAGMTPEERERFKAGMDQFKYDVKSRWGCHIPREQGPNQEAPAGARGEA